MRGDAGEARIRALLERIQYRPGWRIEMPADRFERHEVLELLVIAEVPDTYHPERIGKVAHRRPITTREMADHLPDRELLLMIREQLHEVERHEADEWLLVDGRRIFDPHADPAERRAMLEAAATGTPARSNP